MKTLLIVLAVVVVLTAGIAMAGAAVESISKSLETRAAQLQR